MTTKTLSVAAINKGTVIDHIRAGQAFPILHLLRLVDKNMVTVGLNLPSKRLGLKDLIKIENRLLTDAEANDIVVLAPEVTINIVENFEVVKKINTRLPETIKDVFVCPNLACITHAEPVLLSMFKLEDQGKILKLICHYCERTFNRDDVKLKM